MRIDSCERFFVERRTLGRMKTRNTIAKIGPIANGMPDESSGV
jgi:hypothetical protein